jgi:YHS domain
MKKTIMMAVTLVAFAGSVVLLRADEMTNMPGMDMGGMTQTNNSAINTNEPVKPYPLDYCIVSGDKLGGDMGKPIVMNYKGQEIKFCCASCPKKFKKNPDKYLKEIQDAVDKQNKEKQ